TGDRTLDLFRTRAIPGGEHVAVIVRHRHFAGVGGADLLAADDHGDLDPFPRHPFQRRLQFPPLVAPRRVREHRLVSGLRDARDATHSASFVPKGTVILVRSAYHRQLSWHTPCPFGVNPKVPTRSATPPA